MSRRLPSDLRSLRGRTCRRCELTLPYAHFERNYGACTECRSQGEPHEQVAALATEYVLRCQGARSLLKLGLSVAAVELLTHGTWPTLAEARRLQGDRAA